MYISKVSIQNFRSFGANTITFEFNKGVNVVIGENNNGKSALIDALRIAFSCLQYKKNIFFNQSDFHVDASGNVAQEATISIYLKEVPMRLIEIYDPEEIGSGEFHLLFSLQKKQDGSTRVTQESWGGKSRGNILSVDTLEAIQVAYLSALRDATKEMRPARNSKLAELLSSIANNSEQQESLIEKLKTANQEIQESDTFIRAQDVINKNLHSIEQDFLFQNITLGLLEPRFESIAGSIRSWILPRWHFIPNDHCLYQNLSQHKDFAPFIDLEDNGLFVDIDNLIKANQLDQTLKNEIIKLRNRYFEISQNGLGYNNLLFMSTVLGNISLNKIGIETNLFLIEEPEAHLHPQLQELVFNFFSKSTSNEQNNIQVIMTSHSPTLVSKVKLNQINLIYEHKHTLFNYPLANSNLDEKETNYLETYLDVTKSQFFFAKGILFVEGISEALLIPEFAKRLNRPLDQYAVELVNINGVGFNPFAKLLAIPDKQYGFAKCSIITDDDRCSDKKDPQTYISKDLDFDDNNLLEQSKKIEIGKPSARFLQLSSFCDQNKTVSCYPAIKTFEYALALEPDNIECLLKAISHIHPIIHNDLEKLINSSHDKNYRAFLIWLCIRERGKAEFAQEIARILKTNKKIRFSIPKYIQEAIYNVTKPRTKCEEESEAE